MARFSVVFGLANTQATLDFVDVDLATDTPLYLDPYAIEIRGDEWSAKCGDAVRSFFTEVLGALRARNDARVGHLMSHLGEPNETYLGQSEGAPSGRGVGSDRAARFAEALRRSRAFQTGVIGDISEAELFIHGVGPDMISDLTTNIVRGHLAEYTKQQCDLHGIPTRIVRSLGPVWRVDRSDWIASDLELPVHAGKPILLVPKFSVRFKLSLDSQEFYNHHMVEYLKREYLNANSALVQVLKKTGERYVTKKSVKERHPFIKDDLARFVFDHPEVLEAYKAIKGASGPIPPDMLEMFFDETAFAQALIQNLQAIPAGNNDASRYHHHALAISTFLFYPQLITPVKEFELHQGRKRLDIRFTNAAESGFFHAMMASPQGRALSIPVECKNYRKEMRNPELDQLSGRFSHHRGFVGLLLCRSMDNRDRIIAGCRDTANDGRGFMIVLEDADLIQMLGFVQNNSRWRIDEFLHERFAEITH
ncbi:hypothetical protein GOA58_07005 [Sinorhizobium meliloti]|uniref:hypothetical protein n=1 Tax=Sinorhizobium TaxID=28105 RepID=UPI000FD94E68|nr:MULTISPECIES: hypothetical protein [Sinorhizobium]MDW9447438.1 hypothetical protein [Sinorhizobium meliloti]MDW9660327.1 hypothetical protein [Sinorhizobium meliloti]MDX0049896.1 hypothetical protein [Sinorhizobium meliloti]MQV98342.1 hypothetical protein [Sinorhizobium medicae]RVH11498.1 hypothetical protein CN216_25885 [Sinorhizobium meliloti]